ncbi:class I SAM-dependent methyltransferase [Gemmata sp.]|uniref:class I SAM-dependent methyltransferase n=1 Tax=Gemmata sp. TaxID=1914242 RepID=UPI003F7086A2
MAGVKAILSRPWAYRLFQRAVGAARLRAVYVRRYVRPFPGARVLDIGCGPGDILDSLPGTRYVGVDLSPEYIREARERYGPRGEFVCRSVSDLVVEHAGSFDIVLANGVLHHLDDTEADSLLAVARQALGPGGRFVSFDGCYAPGQNRFARWMLDHDRGTHVRRREEYLRLARARFPAVESHLHHRLLNIPYTHLVMVCTQG